MRIFYRQTGMYGQSTLSSEGRITAPALVHKTEPIYPEAAKESGISGDVHLAVTTDNEGTVMRVSAVNGHPELAKAAITAVRQWRYAPAFHNDDGMPVAASFGLVIRFLPDGTVDSNENLQNLVEEAT